MKLRIFIYTYVIPVRSIQVVLWYPVDTLSIFSNFCSGTSGTTSRLLYEPVLPLASGAIRGHIATKLHKLEMVLDAGRGWWSA